MEGFNPRTPCGVRPERERGDIVICVFQSTHSLRSATGLLGMLYSRLIVSIHALLAECDKILLIQ